MSDHAWNVYYKANNMTRYIPEFSQGGTYNEMLKELLHLLKSQRDNPQTYQYQWILKNSVTKEIIPGELFHE